MSIIIKSANMCPGETSSLATDALGEFSTAYHLPDLPLVNQRTASFFCVPSQVDMSESVLELDGYVDKATQIMNLMIAGQNLADFRAGFHPEFGDGEPEDYEEDLDPTIRHDFDEFDYLDSIKEIKRRVRDRKKAASDAAKKTDEAPSSAPLETTDTGSLDPVSAPQAQQGSNE